MLSSHILHHLWQLSHAYKCKQALFQCHNCISDMLGDCNDQTISQKDINNEMEAMSIDIEMVSGALSHSLLGKKQVYVTLLIKRAF